jgi:peptidoglycan/xylan/chitin deacetylase (PgdA/CDA1 family)
VNGERYMPSCVVHMRSLLKHSLAAGAWLLRTCSLPFASTPEVVVLMYHAIDRSGWKLAIKPELFERQLVYLVSHARVVPIDAIVAHARGEKVLASGSVAITFDDGYMDFLHTALPIIERFAVPVTVFVSSDCSVQTGPDNHPRMQVGDLQQIAQSPYVTIGSHAITHRKFSELSDREVEHEAKESMVQLTHMLGTSPMYFAYPYGARSQQSAHILDRVGYRAAFGVSEGIVKRGDPLFALKRVQVDSTMSWFLFRVRLTAALEWNRFIVDSMRFLTRSVWKRFV